MSNPLDVVTLYFDTETADYSEDNDPALPCEIACVLGTPDRVFATFGMVVSQTHWVGIRENPIVERVVKIHGIDNAMARKHGHSPDILLNQFRWMMDQADQVAAHNISFDVTVMNYAYSKQQLPPLQWKPLYCTMRESAPIIRIPSGGRYAIGGWKAPKLSEAYRYFAKKELVGAHNALADVYACRLVHKGIVQYHNQKVADAAPVEVTP